jgi:hypothetical protein
MLLGELLAELPDELARQVFTHASWSESPSGSYTRLAFLGDSVLALTCIHAWKRTASVRAGSRRSVRRRSLESPAGRSPSAWGYPSACERQRRRVCARARLRWWRPSAYWRP